MKNSTRKMLAWILILVPAVYIAYHAILNKALSVFGPHTWVLISVVIWLIGDMILNSTKK